jgi:hypothetical protein
MRAYMPERLDGKIVLTNTVTARDIEDLRARGVTRLITSTPEFAGRSFGTNVVEAALVAYLGKGPDAVSAQEYRALLERLDLHPRAIELAPA